MSASSAASVIDPPHRPARLGEMLIDRRQIEQEDLERALEIQKERSDKLGKILVDLGFIAMRDVLAALSEQLGIPLATLEEPPPAAAEIEGLSPRSTDRPRRLPRSRGCRRGSCGNANLFRWRSTIRQSPWRWPTRWISRPSPRCGAFAG